jgi:hypothetical protein
MQFVKGIPDAPYFIFIKGISELSDEEVLELLNLRGPNLVESPKYNDWEFCIYISRDQHWTHLMDNWLYSNWYSTELTDRIEELSKRFEIFSCSIGDCDRSFAFKYFKNGEKIREYVVESPNYNDNVLKINFGNPLPGEGEGLKKKNELDRVLFIAKQLGIQLPKSSAEIKCYQ